VNKSKNCIIDLPFLDIWKTGICPRYGFDITIWIGKHFIYLSIFLPEFGIGKDND